MKAIITVIDDEGKVIVEKSEILPKSEDFWGNSTRVAKFEFTIHAVNDPEKNNCKYPKDDMRYRCCKYCESTYICKYNET